MMSFWKLILSYLLPKAKDGYTVFLGMSIKERWLCIACLVIGYIIGKFF